jgi:SnoaL-like domain
LRSETEPELLNDAIFGAIYYRLLLRSGPLTMRFGEDRVEISRAALDAERRQAMSSISTLLSRNLHDVFGENDPARRRAAIEEIFTEDGVFYDPTSGAHRGRDEIDRVAGAIRATHPDFRYQPIAEPEELGNGGRLKWVSGRPGEAPAYAGTDFIIAQDARIAAVYLFFDKLP